MDQPTIVKILDLLKNLASQDFNQLIATYISVDTLRIILNELWGTVEDGLTISDIEDIALFILFIRFVILAIRYNLKTSFYMTCIALFAGYLWYQHLIDVLYAHRLVLMKLPFLHKLGMDIIQLSQLHYQKAVTSKAVGENVLWYKPGKVFYYAFTKGIVDVDPDTGLGHYIDLISMIISNLPEPAKSNIIPIYYKIYHTIIPKIFDICCKYWRESSSTIAYAFLTRIGKKYCPYFIRWHWTFIILIGALERILIAFLHRLFYFQTEILIPKLELYPFLNEKYIVKSQIYALNIVAISLVLLHMSFVILGLLHAICGQYFYCPFFRENTELHVGPRSHVRIYNGGLGFENIFIPFRILIRIIRKQFKRLFNL